MKSSLVIGASVMALLSSAVSAAPFCDMSAYKASPGLTASAGAEDVTVTWEGAKAEELRMRLALGAGVPTIQEISTRHDGGDWVTVAGGITPIFRVTTGYRRMENEMIKPLKNLGVEITPAIVNKYKWDAFWDAPLMVPGTEKGGYEGTRPPTEPIGGQLGMPRTPSEVQNADVAYKVESCMAKTDGASLEVSFPGVNLGVFDGSLVLTVYKGTNLIKQEVVAKTQKDSVAYRYEAGLKGLPIEATSHVAWHGLTNVLQDYSFGAAVNQSPVTLQTANRLVVAEVKNGSIAAFPPPHNFFWSREIAYNLGYNWYSKDSQTSFSFGVREAGSEADPNDAGRGPLDYRENFALRSARPGTWQHMPVYLYVTGYPASEAFQSALAFTHGDHYKVLDGYKVMATHFHGGLTTRLLKSGGLNNMLPDFEVVKNAGIDIYAPIDGDGSNGSHGIALAGAGHVKNQAAYYEMARLHSDKNFVVMPNEEIMSGEVGKLARMIGGHSDLFMSHPVYWTASREAGQPLVEDDATYGKIYHIGSPDDLFDMMHREDLLIYMPHPRTKGSAGYPEAIKDRSYFIDEAFRGIGFRWGMGVDGSEVRLCEYRCLPALDDMNNWVADKPTPPKYVQAISELYALGPGDDVYANDPVNYVKLAALPGTDNWKPIVDAMRSGDYFVTSGEVLVPNYEVRGNGRQRTIVADVEWTFPLSFVEVVWGDGKKTDRKVISAKDLPPFGKHHFEIPFDARGKKWVRFAVWDSAGDGALLQPVKLTPYAAKAALH